MGRTEADLNIMGAVLGFDPKHYPEWTDREKAALGDVSETAKAVKERLENGGCKVKEMYAIRHGGGGPKPRGGHGQADTPRPPSAHIHIVVKFEPGGGKPLAELAEICGINENFIEPPKSGRYSYDNMLSYLTHIKYADKCQYDPHDVITIAGKDYMDYYRERHEAWQKARAKITLKNTSKNLDTLIAGILDGKFKKRLDFTCDPDYAKVYMLHSKKINTVLNARSLVAQDREFCRKFGE